MRPIASSDTSLEIVDAQVKPRWEELSDSQEDNDSQQSDSGGAPYQNEA